MGRLTFSGRLRGAGRAGALAAGLLLAGAPAPARSAASVTLAVRPRTLYLEYREVWIAQNLRVADPATARVRRSGRVWMSAAGVWRESLEQPRLLRWFVGDERWEWLPEHQVAAHWRSAAWPDRGWWLFGPSALRAAPKPDGTKAGPGRVLDRACTIYERSYSQSMPRQQRQVLVTTRVWWDNALGLPLRRSIALDNWEIASIEATRLEPDLPIADGFFTDRRLPTGTRVFEAPLDLESLNDRWPVSGKPNWSKVFFNLRFWAVTGLREMVLPVPYNVPKGYDYEGLMPDGDFLSRRGESPPVPRPLRFAFLNFDTGDILWWSLDAARGPLPASGALRQLQWSPARIVTLPGGSTRLVCDLAGTRVTAEAHGLDADALAGLIENAGAWWTEDIAVSFVGWARRWRWLPEAVALTAKEGRVGLWTTPAGTDEVVLGVQEDGPAERAGLRPWDRLIAVDGVPLAELGKGMRQDDRRKFITARIRGPVGSAVVLRVLRSGHAGPIDVKATRSVEPQERM